MRLIDADRLLTDKMKSKYYHLPNGDIAIPLIDIEHAPTIEERKTGKWLPENRTIDAFWVCSSCGFPSEAHAANILYNFCPNCGADMRGEKHETD